MALAQNLLTWRLASQNLLPAHIAIVDDLTGNDEAQAIEAVLHAVRGAHDCPQDLVVTRRRVHGLRGLPFLG